MIKEYKDLFFVDDKSKTVTEIYYNPDSASCGQIVINYFGFDDVLNWWNGESEINHVEYNETYCAQYLYDDSLPMSFCEMIMAIPDENVYDVSVDKSCIKKIFAHVLLCE